MEKLHFLGKIEEAVIQMLYAFEVGKNFEEKELIEVLMHELKVSRSNVAQAYLQAKQIWDKRVFFDAMIEQHSTSYAIERIGEVEKAILRFSLAELQEGKDKLYIISSSLRLVKKFSTLESTKYVRAVLDAIINAGKT